MSVVVLLKCIRYIRSYGGGASRASPLHLSKCVWLSLKLAILLSLTACVNLPLTNQETNTSAPRRLVLATTTSTDNSGLLDEILPDFEARFDIDVEVVAVGTGQAIRLGENGDADVLLVHARHREDAFIASGYGLDRQDVMYNDFVIVGPATDPAGVRTISDVTIALAQIAKLQSPFVSRGDDSGTHIKEQSLWGNDVPAPGDWYLSVGQGMGGTLTVAHEQQAYTLSDRATFLARTLEGIDLEILLEGDPRLFNPYGVIAVNPMKHPTVNYDDAQAFITWLTSLETQASIAQFGTDSFGQPLFNPDSQLWRDTNP
ncbi:MAG: substrate-binding domain-containing protein [Chloroflexota bacterium]